MEKNLREKEEVSLFTYLYPTYVTKNFRGLKRYVKLLQSKGRGWFMINYYRKDSPSVSGGSFPHAHLLGSKCPPPEERRLSMPETGEKERNCLFKSYTDLE